MLYRCHVLVCSGSNCALGGGSHLKEVLTTELRKAGLGQEIRVLETGCFGLCSEGPVIVIYPEGIHYCRVRPTDISDIVQEHLLKGRVVTRLLYKGPLDQQVGTVGEFDFYSKQRRIVLRNAGLIDPENIDDYIVRGGYEAFAWALTRSPQQIIDEITKSRLQGRGGAGFPTGRKWQFTSDAPGNTKYIVCNADEGEPGTSKDRLILEGDPHATIEGMAIAGYAVGASKGYVYIRGEYKLSTSRMRKAIQQATSLGLLGENIFESGFSFDIEVRSGAGAYVCGEETALLESIEGNRGEPRFKPPYPAVNGLWGRPTLINNVETLANIAPILLNGADWFLSIGTPDCPGTKVFTLSGNVQNKGLIEVPMGTTLREIVFDIGGGIPSDRKFKIAQTGGTSGGIISADQLDVPMDIPSLTQIGTSLGSGALLIADDRHCIVDLAKTFLKFFAHESCGQCTPCREGVAVLLKLVNKIADGSASIEDIEAMKRLCETMQTTSLCGLGQTAPVPILSALRFFHEEYLAHIEDNECPLGVCS